MSSSVWMKTTCPPSHSEADVVVVGAGITGLSLAYWLSELAPELKLMVIDREGIGAGASGRNAGFNTAGSTAYLAHLIEKDGMEKAREFWSFKQESLRLMREHLFDRFIGVAEGFEGSLTLYRDQAHLERELSLIESVGAPMVKRVGTEEVAQFGLSGFAGGLRFAHEGSCHPLRLLEALKLHLQERGVSFLLGQTAGWLESDGTGTRVMMERGHVRASHVFVALNGYASQFHPSLGSLVSPKRAQMIALDGTGLKLRGNYYDPAHRVYFRLTPQSELLLGGMRLLEEKTEDSDFDKITQVIQSALRDYAGQTFGKELPVLARWSGVMGFTATEKPQITPMPGLAHATFVGGFSGHGMGAGFGTARSAVFAFLGRELPSGGVLPC